MQTRPRPETIIPRCINGSLARSFATAASTFAVRPCTNDIQKMDTEAVNAACLRRLTWEARREEQQLSPSPSPYLSLLTLLGTSPTSAAGILSAGGSEALGTSVGESSQLQIRTDDERAGTSKSPGLAEKKRDPK